MNNEEIKADLQAELEKPLEWWIVLMSEVGDESKIAIMPARGKYTALYELQKAGENLDMFYCVSSFELPKKLVDIIPEKVVGKSIYIGDFLKLLSGEKANDE